MGIIQKKINCAKCGVEYIGSNHSKYCALHSRKAKRIVPNADQKAQWKANKNAARNAIRKAETVAKHEAPKPISEDELDKILIANQVMAMAHRSIKLYSERMHTMSARDLPTAAMQLAKVYEILTGGQGAKHNFTTVTIAMVPPAGVVVP